MNAIKSQAGFWIRVGAKLVDGLLFGAMMFIPLLILKDKINNNPHFALERMIF